MSKQTVESLQDALAKELERHACRVYSWSDQEFETWWHKDKRNKNHAKQQAIAKLAIDFIVKHTKTKHMTESILLTQRTLMRRIVCAACKLNTRLIVGPRHFDGVMRQQMFESENWNQADQGFIDQYGKYLDREEALKVAIEADQIRRTGPGFMADTELFSENLY